MWAGIGSDESQVPERSRVFGFYPQIRSVNVSNHFATEAFASLSIRELLPILSWTGVSHTSA